MNEFPTTDFVVLEVKGRSKSGGQPDAVANSYMRKWYLQPKNGNAADLYADAIPWPAHRDKLRLRLWREGSDDSPLKGQFCIDLGGTIGHLERGRITDRKPVEGNPEQETICMEGQYVLDMAFTCQRLADTSKVEPSVGLARPDRLLHEDVRDILPGLATSTTRPPESCQVTTTVVPISQQVKSPKPIQQPTPERTVMKYQHEAVLKRLNQLVCEELGISLAEIGMPNNRTGNVVWGRKMRSHIAKDVLGIKGSEIKAVYYPNSSKTDPAVYTQAAAGKKAYDSDKNSRLQVDRIVAKIKNLQPVAPTIPPQPANVARPSAAMQNKGPVTLEALQQGSMFALLQLDVSVDKIATAFGISPTEVYAIVGYVNVHFNGESAKLRERIRRLLGKTSCPEA